MHTFPLAQQFTVQPESVVQAEGLEAVFECLDPGAVGHVWVINGEYLDVHQFPSDMTRIPASENTPSRLIIPATPQYNNTVVQCVPVSGQGSNMREPSENASLQIQGESKILYSIPKSQ